MTVGGSTTGRATRAPAPKEPGNAELKQLVAAAEKGKVELQDFVLTLKQQLAERDAALAELDGERREIGRLREAVRAAEQRADKAEASERETRKKLAEAEGTILKLRAGAPLASPAATVAAAPPPDVAALQAELEKWKQKESDSRAEAWKAHKQRADAETAAAEVREDTVRKLKDARKLASLDLTRATEEAMKKAVTLKEELTRAERERKELLVEVKRLKAELETVRSLTEAASSASPAGGPDAAIAPGPEGDVALRGRVSALERELMNADAIAAADRARAAQLLADMERESQERSDVTVRLRHSLRERDREVAALRHDLSERDARLTAVEQSAPASDEIERLEAELSTARTRLGTAMQELARKEAQVERASAAAAHERARAERMMNEQRYAQDSVSHARGRAADAERQLDVARERLGRLELELKGEADRVGALEQAVRRAVDSARNGHGGPA
ncbi:MAG: hypothetical protein JWN44_4803 [Myxococcales bacterium]|nr:hypothetical protein [Myxococcales bacterium]